jgi:hypothetical protein
MFIHGLQENAVNPFLVLDDLSVSVFREPRGRQQAGSCMATCLALCVNFVSSTLVQTSCSVDTPYIVLNLVSE